MPHKSKKGKLFASFILDGDENIVSISKNAEEITRDKLFISLCEDNEKKRFYFIHRPMWKRGLETKRMEVTSLNLDEILAQLCNSNFDLSIL